MTKYKFLPNTIEIALAERIPHPSENFKSPYFSKLSEILNKIHKIVLYRLVEYFELEKMHR